MSRVYNFCSGPAALPEDVLKVAQQEMLDWHGSGASIMEMSHRSPEFTQVAKQSIADLKALLSIPDNYRVLFMQGGATAQFSLLPLNLAQPSDVVDFIITGVWSQKALKEAQRYTNVHVAASTEDQKFYTCPKQADLSLSPNAAYVHYTPNETIGGVEFDYIPDTGNVPLVADMSSTILSRPIDVSRFGVIYAGAQKNIGPAGLTLVIIREDLLGRAQKATPSVFDFSNIAKADSVLNTPPTYSWYLASLVFTWLKQKGGVNAFAELNHRKAQKLYKAIDDSQLYVNPIHRSARSWMNIPFILQNEDLNERFLVEAKQQGLINLEGHRSVGGMRASLYNALPEEGVDALIQFMTEFESKYAG